MKASIVLLISVLLSTGSLAQLSGSDNFNDNIRDPAKWEIWGPGINLAETNGRMEFISTGTGHEQDAWIWTLNTGSYTQDWSVVIDAVNSCGPLPEGQRSSIGMVVANTADFGDIFVLDFTSTTTPFAASGWQTDYTGNWWEATQPVSTNAIKLRIAFDSTTKRLSSSYDSGTGFTVLTNFNVGSWTMTDTETFSIAINSLSIGYPVTSGQIYADNFIAGTVFDQVHASIFNAVEIGWFAAFGDTYQVQYISDLESTNWINFGDVIVGDGSTNYVFDTTRDRSNRFYRVKMP